MRFVCKTLISNSLLVLLLAFVPMLVTAQDASTPASQADVLISLRPKDKEDGSRFEAEVAPGQTVELVAVLQNFGTEPINLRSYVSGLIPGNNGGLKISGLDVEQTGSTLWLAFPNEEMTLDPNQAVERPITVTVPEDAQPGQYVNAIVLETVDPINPGQGGAFEQYFRKVVSIYVTVPGNLKADFTLGEPEVLVAYGHAGVQIPVKNTGQLRIDLVGNLKVSDSEGNVVHEGEIRLGPIYMGQETFIQVPFASLPTAGDYLISYSFTDVESEVQKSTEEQAIVVPEDSNPIEQAPVAFENVTVEPNADPIVFANVSVDVTLAQSSYRSTRLTMSVYHDGKHVEDFVMADNLSLAQGTTNVAQRYLPATGFVSGEFTFSLKLESIESGQTSVLFEEKDVATLEVP